MKLWSIATAKFPLPPESNRGERWMHVPPFGRRRASLRGLACGAVVFLVLLGLWGLGLLRGLEWDTLDARFVARFLLSGAGRPLPVTIVAIDDRSVEELGRWPWQRSVQSRLLTEVMRARPRVVGVDIVYSEPSAVASHDRSLAESLRGDIPVVVAAARGSDGELLPLPSLLGGNVRIGHINSVPDPDGVARRLPFTIDTSRGKIPTLSWAMAEELPDAPFDPPPVAPDGRFLVNYRPHSDTSVLSMRAIVETVSALDVLQGRAAASLAGRAVLVGVTAAGLDSIDEHLTPLRPLGRVPGVFIHAAALASILEGAYLHSQSAWSVVALLAVVALSTGVAFFLLRPWAASILAALCVGAYAVVAIWRFNVAGEVVEVVPALLAMVANYVAGLWHAHRVADREAKRIAEMFRRYVAPEAVDILLAEPGLADLDGGRRKVSVLIADIHGFTRFAEGTAPEDVVRTLNRYLERMTESIHLHGGMVDKFMGDGILAVFGAPVPREDHAEAALRAALHLLRQVEIVRKEGVGEGLSVSVGVHTGEAVVGSIGSTRRREYTAIGDAVNVTARLQELASPGTILTSAASFHQCPSRLDAKVEPLDPVEVRGRSAPIPVFRLTPSGLENAGDEAV